MQARASKNRLSRTSPPYRVQSRSFALAHEREVGACSCLSRRHQLVCNLVLASTTTKRSASDERDDTQSVQDYDSFASDYDALDSGKVAEAFGFPALRQRLLAQAKGAVLETGAGTGINLAFYNFGAVESLTALDISRGMLQQAQMKAELMAKRSVITFKLGDVQALPFGDASFDTVVDTFSVCVYPDPAKALSEMARVVRPGGEVLLLEHSRSDNALLGLYQDVTSPAVAKMGKGCVWNQNLTALLQGAGLKVTSRETQLGGTISMLSAIRVLPGPTDNSMKHFETPVQK